MISLEDYKVVVIVEALEECHRVLFELSHHDAFAGKVPEFNVGGIGYNACAVARRALAIYQGDTP